MASTAGHEAVWTPAAGAVTGVASETAIDAGRLRAGQRWRYPAPAGFETSRMLIGAIISFEDGTRVVCCCVEGAPRRLSDGALTSMTIPFLPMSDDAFARSVVDQDGEGAAPQAFLDAYAEWKTDPKGFSCFSVPFEGFLDRLIALQMADIVGAR